MATKRNTVISGFTNANKEAAYRYSAIADDQEAALPRLLRPDEVAGEYDAGRLLTTTLGGARRMLTKKDLAVFKRNAEALGKRFRGGITAKGIIDLSLPADRQRSNTQIHVALPRQMQDGNVHFVTNAGPGSKVTRHHVLVHFMNYDSAVAAPSSPAEAVKMLTNGPLKCSCDCEHWRYRYSYVATIGKFNAAIPQLGYPKLTNPMLVGAACKHVLRVMQQVNSPLVRQYLQKMIEAGRKKGASKLLSVTKKDAEKLAEQQKRQVSWKRNSVESVAEKRLRLAQQRAAKEAASKANARVAKLKSSPEKLAKERAKFEQTARRLAAMGGISQSMLADLLSKVKGK